MIENPADFIPAWMLLSAAFGFIAGDAYGDQARHRKCLEETNADLRDQFNNAPSSTPELQQALHQQRRIINDIHKRLITVTKGLEKRAS